MIILVGSNPSPLNLDPKIAFEGSKSYPILKRWLRELNVTEYELINLSDKILCSGEQLRVPDINYERLLEQTKGKIVIGLGNIVSKALKRIRVDHFKLPHPSPKNRKLNDKSFEQSILRECREWLK